MVLVFDTIPLLAIIAGFMSFVGHDRERFKWRVIGFAMLAATLLLGMIFGFSTYTDPIKGLVAR